MKLRLFVLLSLVVISGNLFAQKKWPATLLWKISGNGLQKDSYLYGSMHLQDKRLFHFPDSLYHFLEKADGFAMEVNINEMIDSMIMNAFNGRKRRNEEDARAIYADSTVSAIDDDTPPPPPTPGKILKPVEKTKARRTLTRAKNTKEEMPTIMDAWLYNVASRQGKWVGAIEDVQDQISILDEFGTSVSESKPVSNVASLIAVEMMVNYYLKKDLNAIQKWIVDREDDFEMLRRNQKMARRMDSLAHIRSVFFTVGAAHLPGDSGVIQLLRRKGFRVEPVMTTKTINPDTYIKNLPPAKWITFKEGRGLFDIEMPGNPTEINENGFEGHMYFDLSNMTFYLVSAIPVYVDVSLDTLVEKFRENTKGELISSKKITYKSLPGVEALMTGEDAHYTLRLVKEKGLMYMLIAGGVDSGTIASPETSRYFASLNPRKIQENSPENKNWVTFAPPGKGVEIKFPSNPKRNKSSEKVAEGTNWNFLVYDLYDPQREGYFLINIRDIEPGFHMTEDSIFFNEIQTNVQGHFTEMTETKPGIYQGYPSYYIKGINEESGTTYAIFMVIRGNRIYQLIAGGSTANENVDAMIDEYFYQLKLVDYEAIPYTLQNAPAMSFQTYGPAPFDVYTDTSEGPKKTQHYISFDKQARLSYEIFAEPLSRYTWAATDSAFLEERGNQYIATTDSVLSKKMVSNGKLPAMHWHIRKPDSNLKMDMRIMASKDTVYTLLTFVQTQELAITDAFFSKFLPKNSSTNNITVSKSALLFKDIQSKDSVIFQEAKAALENAVFDKKDLPALHKHILYKYLDDTLNHYWSVRGQLVNKVALFQDKSSIDFVKEKYPALAKDPKSQYFLIDLLSDITTKESYQLLRDILSKNPPTEIEDHYLSINWYDSLELSRVLYPDIFKQLENPLLSDAIMNLTDHMLQEEYLSPSDLKAFHPQLLAIGRKKAEQVLGQPAEEISFYDVHATLRVMAGAEDAEMNNVLKDFLAANHPGIKMQAALTMISKKMEVPQQVWDSIGANIYYRRDLYDSLVARGQVSLFPARYLRQELMAASDMYNYASDDYQPDKVELLEEREIDINGIKKRIYIFQIVYSYEGDDGEKLQENYLGMVGAYSVDKNNMTNEWILNSMADLVSEEEVSLEEQVETMIAEALERSKNSDN